MLRHELETLIPPYSVVMRRSISTQEVTKNIYLVTEDKRKIETDPKTLRYDNNFDKHVLYFIVIKIIIAYIKIAEIDLWLSYFHG